MQDRELYQQILGMEGAYSPETGNRKWQDYISEIPHFNPDRNY